MDGHTISVAEGTYYENINYNGKNISVMGANMDSTIIDGNQNGTVVTIPSFSDSTALLKNFTIQNGNAINNGVAGGIDITSSDIRLKNVIVKDNNSTNNVGGISIAGYSPALDSVYVENNVGNNGGGIFINGNPTITNSIIRNNQAGNGAGVRIDVDSSPILENVIITP